MGLGTFVPAEHLGAKWRFERKVRRNNGCVTFEQLIENLARRVHEETKSLLSGERRDASRKVNQTDRARYI
jgi:hypothetical protein